MAETVEARQIVGLCPQCGKMLYLSDDLRSYCYGCGRPDTECVCYARSSWT